MKKTLLRLLSALLMLTMLLSLFVACNDETSNNENTTDETTAEPTVPAELSEYRIVYSASASDYVKTNVVSQLQSAISQRFGLTLEAVSDAEEATYYEIVIGDTTRSTETTNAYLDDLRGKYSLEGKYSLSYGHAIVTDGTRVYLLAKSDDALLAAANDFCGKAVKELADGTFGINEDPYFSPIAKTEDAMELADGADIRVMSYNILMSQYAAIESNARDVRVANIIMYYMPDVVALQETEELWHNRIDELLVKPGIYKKACEKIPSGLYNMTTFIYNPKTVKLIEENVYHVVANSTSRNLSVALFERLSDGTRFVVTNFHPAPDGYVQEHAEHFKRLFNLSDGALGKYEGLPLIMMGDFNTTEQHDMYKKFMLNLNVKDAKYEADVLVRHYATYLKGGPYGVLEKGDNNCYDHIFVNSHTDVKLFNFVIDHEVTLTSDHIPIYADIALK